MTYRESLEEKIKIMQAALRGDPIEVRPLTGGEGWARTANPIWDWDTKDYRISPPPAIPDIIDWSHVAPQFRYLARDENGRAYLSTHKPTALAGSWSADGAVVRASYFVSYIAGTAPWDRSLVERPVE